MTYFLVFSVLSLVVLAFLPVIRNVETKEICANAIQNAPGDFIGLSRGNVYYQLQGPEHAELVVFVHGFSVPSYTWERNVCFLLEQGYRVLSYDLYGRGFSARPDMAYNRTAFVEQLAELLQALSLDDQVSLVGLSMGGAIVAAFAAQYPEKVQRQVLIAPFNAPVAIGPLSVPVLGEYLGYAFYVPQLPARQLQDFSNPGPQQDWVDRFRMQMTYRGFRRAILASARDFIQSQPIADYKALARSTSRSLLLWGDADATFPIDQADRVRSWLGSDSEYRVIADAGHLMHYEYADEVNAHILAFLRSPSADSGPATPWR